MHNIQIDYMRNHFLFFVNFFYLPNNGTPVFQLNSWQVEDFSENFFQNI